MRLFPVRTLSVSLLALAAVPAAAQDAPAGLPPTPPPGTIAADTYTIGVGAVTLPSYEGSDNNNILPAPGALISHDGYFLTVLGTRASLDLIRNEAGPVWDIQAGPIAVLNLDRTRRSTIDDARVEALGDRNAAIELGGFVGIGKTGVLTSDYDQFNVTLSYRYDVANAHESGIWQPSVSYFTPLSTKSAIGLFATAEHVGDRYARYYFSVPVAGAVASGLPTFNADGGWKNFQLGAIGTYALTGDLLHGWKIVAGGTYSRLQNDFKDSPVVSIAGDRDQWLGTVGIAYTF
ncbi:MipA/OmpV family protein [Sphingomonas rubra]|uniref:Outer membrane scaffolding protein for murein synthesis, MipA/OmpV family n=1 Tax=Sphingomonas rubra TaxID=634430 RepID=A0A1I5TVB6_9SPHN|nr:MipA/OmpV family protein [Sphingomonas rubra]SFP86994.1 Outer membrane scaffolding protein for murein synthesis, MipA/OmpV family [Sphingomonas rubra]